MKLQIIDNGLEKHGEVLRAQISRRIPAAFDGGMPVTLAIDPALGAESYRVDAATSGWQITGGDPAGLYFGIGKFLHAAKWGDTDFTPVPTDGTVSPDCPFRMIYFALHFYNWYHMASESELREYMLEMMLWGYNSVITIVPVVTAAGEDDPDLNRQIEKVRAVFRVAAELELKKGLIFIPNEGFTTAPQAFSGTPNFDPLHMRGDIGRNLCLSLPGAVEYMKKLLTGLLGKFRDTKPDYVMSWPYDEGGCNCENCRPWGANGYLRGVNLLRECVRETIGDAKFVISTWAFDEPEGQGEFAGLFQALKDGKVSADYVMVDSHDAFPAYPLSHKCPVPVVNFPEISMWKLYPWGGLGATPMPRRFDGFWQSSKAVLSGGMPYSEGIYEDITKIQCVGYYWNKNADWREILAEYISYEVDADAVAPVLEMIDCLEKNHLAAAKEAEPDIAAACRAEELARHVQATLSKRGQKAWRWRLLYARGVLDGKRHRAYAARGMHGAEDVKYLRRFSGKLLEHDEEAQELFRELFALYHCVPHNGNNKWTLVPVNGEVYL